MCHNLCFSYPPPLLCGRPLRMRLCGAKLMLSSIKAVLSATSSSRTQGLVKTLLASVHSRYRRLASTRHRHAWKPLKGLFAPVKYDPSSPLEVPKGEANAMNFLKRNVPLKFNAKKPQKTYCLSGKGNEENRREFPSFVFPFPSTPPWIICRARLFAEMNL